MQLSLPHVYLLEEEVTVNQSSNQGEDESEPTWLSSATHPQRNKSTQWQRTDLQVQTNRMMQGQQKFLGYAIASNKSPIHNPEHTLVPSRYLLSRGNPRRIFQ